MGFQVDRTAVVVTRLGPWMLGCWEGVASGRAVVVRSVGVAMRMREVKVRY